MWPTGHNLLTPDIINSTVSIVLLERDGSKTRANEFFICFVNHGHFTSSPISSPRPLLHLLHFLISPQSSFCSPSGLVHHSSSLLTLILHGPWSFSFEWCNKPLYIATHSYLTFFCLFKQGIACLLPFSCKDLVRVLFLSWL